MKFLTQLRFISLLTLTFVLLSTAIHAEDNVMELDQLEVRNDLRYASEQTQPFTGNAVSYFAEGMQKLQVSFKQGFKHGKEIAWYEDGQLRYVVRYLNGEPQSVGSVWYARTSEANVAVSVLGFCNEEEVKIGFCDPRTSEANVVVSVLGFCNEEEMKIGFCDPGLQESSRIEFTP